MNDFVFLDELPKNRAGGQGGQRKYQAEHDAMRANPGKWMLIVAGAKGVSPAFKSGVYGPGFEYRSRNWVTNQRSCDVYARYVGTAFDHGITS